MNKYIGSSFDDFLKEQNILDETEAVAIKKVRAYHNQSLNDRPMLALLLR